MNKDKGKQSVDDQYRLRVVAQRHRIGEESTPYYISLFKGKKRLVNHQHAVNITDLGSLVANTLFENKDKGEVKLRLKGSFYALGEQMIRDIVKLYNSMV